MEFKLTDQKLSEDYYNDNLNAAITNKNIKLRSTTNDYFKKSGINDFIVGKNSQELLN